MNQLFVDGGVITHNPSRLGGTWAYRILEDGEVIKEASGWITPSQAGVVVVTNNHTEMLALLKGLEELPEEWIGTIYSDSQITIGRAHLGWKWKNVPMWMLMLLSEQIRRLDFWDRLEWVLLDGHPTKAQLISGIGKRGHPVSEHNVGCDQACTKAAEAFRKFLEGKE